ncbi:hypothetical protein FB566_3175 [Stackebrandtia endophytica]|uniref:Uncharacterized protein n=1 Tax=Stackebrandtia endophytica TaxID=1496996 RepID=A0A543AYG1_9ACTN|nr:hypothetical protein FB566_3175 [Stackebrandtia endophytica]
MVSQHEVAGFPHGYGSPFWSRERRRQAGMREAKPDEHAPPTSRSLRTTTNRTRPAPSKGCRRLVGWEFMYTPHPNRGTSHPHSLRNNPLSEETGQIDFRLASGGGPRTGCPAGGRCLRPVACWLVRGWFGRRATSEGAQVPSHRTWASDQFPGPASRDRSPRTHIFGPVGPVGTGPRIRPHPTAPDAQPDPVGSTESRPSRRCRTRCRVRRRHCGVPEPARPCRPRSGVQPCPPGRPSCPSP